jgi:hypothetical protein
MNDREKSQSQNGCAVGKTKSVVPPVSVSSTEKSCDNPQVQINIESASKNVTDVDVGKLGSVDDDWFTVENWDIISKRFAYNRDTEVLKFNGREYDRQKIRNFYNKVKEMEHKCPDELTSILSALDAINMETGMLVYNQYYEWEPAYQKEIVKYLHLLKKNENFDLQEVHMICSC